jgi:hypothetical protein
MLPNQGSLRPRFTDDSPEWISPGWSLGLFRFREGLPEERVRELLNYSTDNFPGLRLHPQVGGGLKVYARDTTAGKEDWAAWRRKFGALIFTAELDKSDRVSSENP